MADKRPSAICGSWFTGDPRVGRRHRACGKAECRAARNRKACAGWRKRHPDEVTASHVRRALPQVPPDPPEVVMLDPTRHFSPAVVRHVMGSESDGCS